MKKLNYFIPKLQLLNHNNRHSFCADGTSAKAVSTDECLNGGDYGTSQCTNGAGATDICNTGAAARDGGGACMVNGLSPAESNACETGGNTA